jgi:hypothetical protein
VPFCRLTSSSSGRSYANTCAPRAGCCHCALAARMTRRRAAAQLHVRLHVNDWAIAHFEKLTRLLAEFSRERIELLEHDYHPAAFGSFVLVLAKGHQQLKFEWDGKESILALHFAKVQNKGSVPAWTHDADFSLPNGVGLYEEIASHSVDMLAT